MKINLNLSNIIIGLLIIFLFYFVINTIIIEPFTFELDPIKSVFKGLPIGSWKNECDLVSYDYPIVTANCQNDQGKPTYTMIDLNSCLEIIHKDPDEKDPSHQYMKRPTIPKQFSTNLPHEHKLRVENGELKCDF